MVGVSKIQAKKNCYLVIFTYPFIRCQIGGLGLNGAVSFNFASHNSG